MMLMACKQFAGLFFKFWWYTFAQARWYIFGLSLSAVPIQENRGLNLFSILAGSNKTKLLLFLSSSLNLSCSKELTNRLKIMSIF